MSDMRETAASLVKQLVDAGHEALFAGGCVRDQLLGKKPKDYDVATSARPDEVLRVFPRAQSVGAHFGVMLVRSGGYHFDIATFREDGEYVDGRHPSSVRFSSCEHDARRRDFTCNGLFYNPLTDQVIDHVGGRADIEAGVIRAIGDPEQRFGEDYLRLMRAVRFATVLGFDIESATYDAICQHAERLTCIAIERVQTELDRIWLSPNRVRGFDLLVNTGLMQWVIPEILALKGCEQPPQWHPEGDVFTHTRLMLSYLPPDAELSLVLSVLLHDIAKPATSVWDEELGRVRFLGHENVGAKMAEAILKRLKYPNAVIDAVTEAVAFHMRYHQVNQMSKAKLKRFMAREHFELGLQLHRADRLGSDGDMEQYHYLVGQGEELKNAPIIPPRLVVGRDLIQRGLQPGPVFKRLLEEVQDLQLEGILCEREEALQWLDKRLTCGI